MTEDIHRPYRPSAVESTNDGEPHSATGNAVRYVAGVVIALASGVIAAPIAFALMWNWDQVGSNLDFSEGVSLVAVYAILVVGVLIASVTSSHLMNPHWPVACALLCTPTILMTGGFVLDMNQVLLVTTVS